MRTNGLAKSYWRSGQGRISGRQTIACGKHIATGYQLGFFHPHGNSVRGVPRETTQNQTPPSGESILYHLLQTRLDSYQNPLRRNGAPTTDRIPQQNFTPRIRTYTMETGEQNVVPIQVQWRSDSEERKVQIQNTNTDAQARKSIPEFKSNLRHDSREWVRGPLRPGPGPGLGVELGGGGDVPNHPGERAPALVIANITRSPAPPSSRSGVAINSSYNKSKRIRRKRRKWYAVRGGPKEGVYRIWAPNGAQEAARNRGTKVKSFFSEFEAEEFVKGTDLSASWKPSPPTEKHNVVWVDGSRCDATDSIGWGAFYGHPTDSRNRNGFLTAEECHPHSCSSQRAELFAVVQVLEDAMGRAEPVHVVTDSRYVLKWTGRHGKVSRQMDYPPDIPHHDLGKRLVEAQLILGPYASFEKVAAHRGVYGNEMVDKMAKSAARDLARIFRDGKNETKLAAHEFK